MQALVHLDINASVLECIMILMLRFPSIRPTLNIIASFSLIPSKYAIIRHDFLIAVKYRMLCK